jgi:hypothetical protein
MVPSWLQKIIQERVRPPLLPEVMTVLFLLMKTVAKTPLLPLDLTRILYPLMRMAT